MSEKKEYKVPDELAEIMEESHAADDARDAVAKMCFFKFQLRNAVELGRIGRKKNREFWAGVYELYPELYSKALSYEANNRVVTLQE